MPRAGPSTSRSASRRVTEEWTSEEETPALTARGSAWRQEVSGSGSDWERAEEVPPAQEAESGAPAYPTEREARGVAQRPSASRRTQNKALTGSLADFPTLGLMRSHDPVCSMAWELRARLVIHKWKVFKVMLQAKAAVERARRPWRRPCRWLAGLLAKETSAIWGHMGAAAQALRGPNGPPLFR